MSGSLSIYGICKAENEQLQKMLRIKRVCDGEGVSYPSEVLSFFEKALKNWGTGDELISFLRDEDESTIESEMRRWDDLEPALKEVGDDEYVIVVKDIPKHIDVIHVSYSW
jgi:hypothetical protein